MENKKYTVVPVINRTQYPMESKRYPYAHEQADSHEKKDYPSGYEKMKSVDAHLNNGEYAGTHTKSGKIEVSSKVPPKYREEVADHEYYEHLLDPGKCAVCRKMNNEH